jgi:hypothetical protein
MRIGATDSQNDVVWRVAVEYTIQRNCCCSRDVQNQPRMALLMQLWMQSRNRMIANPVTPTQRHSPISNSLYEIIEPQ